MRRIGCLFIVAILIALSFLLISCNSYESIQSLEFTDLSGRNLGFSLFFKKAETYKGSIEVSPAKIDKNDIEIICSDDKIIDIEIGSKSSNLISYTVTAKHNGTATIYAQTKDATVRTSEKLFNVSGGSNPTYTIDEQNILFLQGTGVVTKKQAEIINTELKSVGLPLINSATLGWTENDISTILVVCGGLIIDVEVSYGELKRIVVNCNDADDNLEQELVLFDIALNGKIKEISAEEAIAYLESQNEAKDKAVRAEVASIIELTKFNRTSPNSVGGVSINLIIKNNSEKTIKYIHMSYFARNAVGDEVYCSIRGHGIREVLMTGPVEQNKTKSGTADCYWYNYNIAYIGFNYFEIEYMDGTNIVFTRDMMDALVWNLKN